MFRIIPNRFRKKCDKCNNYVEINKGFAVCNNSNWKTYCCANCLPDECKSTNLVPPLNSVTQLSENVVELKFKYDFSIIQAIKSINHTFRKFHPEDKSWRVIVNKQTIDVLKFVLEQLHLKPTQNIDSFVPVADEEEVEKTDETSVSTQLSDNRLKELGLFPFQIEGVKFLQSKKRALLGDDMGLGKSVQALMAIPKDDCVIIVSPSCVKYNWAKEIKKWRPDYTSIIVNNKENFVLPEKNQIVIVNRENIPDYYDKSNENHKTYFNKDLINRLKSICLIVDEAHKFKSTRTIGSKKIRIISKHSHTCWLLTGTPILNRAKDLWGVLAAGHMEKEVFSNYDNFMRLFNAHQGRFGIEFGLPDPCVPALISKVRIARKKETVLPELPSKIFTKMVVSLNDNVEGKKIIAMIDALSPDISKMVHDGMLPPFNKFSKIRMEIAKNRIPAMLEYLDDCEESETPVIVFSAHLAPLNALRSKDNWGIIDGATDPEMRSKIVENFQAGLLDGVACTIEAGGVGLTMTRAQKVLFVDMDWTPANNWQAEDRICRIGSKHRSVEVVQMISDHPLDVHVHNLIEEKKNLIKLSLG
jgi:SWI/SNF-related matrix-associated actin-dependent regulator 1 of chromatin subfamily A